MSDVGKDISFPPNIMVENGHVSQKMIPPALLVRFMVILHGAMIEGRITTNDPLSKHSSQLTTVHQTQRSPFLPDNVHGFSPEIQQEGIMIGNMYVVYLCSVSQMCMYISEEHC